MRSAIPVDACNPGHALACLGIVEALALLGNDAPSRFTLSAGTFEVDLPGDMDPMALAVGAALGSSCAVPPRWQSLIDAARPAKGKAAAPVDGAEDAGGADAKASKTPEHPIALTLRGAAEPVLLDPWLPIDGRPSLKLHAGNQTGIGIVNDIVATLRSLDAVADPASRARVVADPFSATQGVPRKGSGRYGLDTRTARASLQTGWSANALGAKPATYPLVEVLSLLGAQRVRPPGCEGRGTMHYGLWVDFLSPTLARQALALALPGDHGPVVACRREASGKNTVITRGAFDRRR